VIAGFPDDPPTAITDVFYWTPQVTDPYFVTGPLPRSHRVHLHVQVIGGLGFIVSSVLLMLETQKAWWRPALNSLGWYGVLPAPPICAC
jgi:hypothetical protein